MKVQVTLVKSPVSSKPNHIKIVKALGLNKIRATKVFEDTGMGQETFSGRTATESKMEGTHER